VDLTDAETIKLLQGHFTLYFTIRTRLVNESYVICYWQIGDAKLDICYIFTSPLTSAIISPKTNDTINHLKIQNLTQNNRNS